MTDIPTAQPLPGFPFEAKARKKKKKGEPARAVTRTPPFDDVRPFLTAKPLRGLGDAARPAEPAPPLPGQQPDPPAHDENIAA